MLSRLSPLDLRQNNNFYPVANLDASQHFVLIKYLWENVMITTPIATKVDLFTWEHFSYFINKIENQISKECLIYNNKVIQAGISYPGRNGNLAIAITESGARSAIAQEYLSQGKYAFLVIDCRGKEEIAKLWYEVPACLLP